MVTTTWGGLKPGKYEVGFRTALRTDYSRHYGAPAAEAGVPRGFRPVLVATWYPAAAAAGDAPPLTYGDYLAVASADPALAPFATRLSEHNREATIRYGLAAEPEKLDEEGRRALAERERLPMRAVRDAPPAGGRFPVVFYHPGLGGSYEDNGVLCEYLASHGYTVVSSAFPSEDGLFVGVDWDLDRSVKDLGFLMNVAAADPGVDVTRVGSVGQSYGGQALMAWSSEANSPVRAVVSLDSTVDYAPTDGPMFEKLTQPLSRTENVTAAWLLFAVKDRVPNWARWDYLTHTPRWYAGTAHLDHNDFTSQGMIGTALRKAGTPVEAGQVRQRYEAVCELARHFLDGYVKGDEEALDLLRRQADAQRTPQDAPDAGPTTEPPLTLAFVPPSPAAPADEGA